MINFLSTKFQSVIHIPQGSTLQFDLLYSSKRQNDIWESDKVTSLKRTLQAAWKRAKHAWMGTRSDFQENADTKIQPNKQACFLSLLGVLKL